MPATQTTLAQLLLINDRSLADFEVSDVVLAGTMFDLLHGQESSNGTVHVYSREDAAPVVGFRDPNTSANNSPGTYSNVTVNLKVLDATASEDKAIADVWKHGHDAFMAKRGLRNLQVGFHTAEKQYIYGTNNDSDGFVGLVEADGLNQLSDEKVIDAGGSGNDVEDIWIIRTGEEDVSAICNGDCPLDIGEIVVQQLNEYSGGNAIGQYTGYVAPIMSWLGLQIGSKHSVVRIANVDVTSNSIEDAVSDGIALFPSGREATHIFCSRRARNGIKKYRTATTTSGKKAQVPTDVDEVPLHISEAIVGGAALA